MTRSPIELSWTAKNGDLQIKKCFCSKLTTTWPATHFYNQRLGQRDEWAGDDEKGINISLRESSVTWGEGCPEGQQLGEEQRFLPNLGR